ncbi:MAG: PTS-dependent dihydroxyacetone kinase operon transcriptional regulator DhaR [Chloroflexi bacterium]|nr:MAG: PTS-dependent dihydroxyacetone kinase operon transcriptional regulator DhaR [Chloroflexota bacterium]PIE79794.1 MAG: PTS-dependent dihydroxyacetone kinase operon transcriptional regulator DhaR [Chloroflexota bacterium]
MKPSDYPIRRDVLKQFWFSFMKTGQVNSANDLEPDPEVVRSWQRCAPRLDPRQAPRLVTLKEQAMQTIFKTHEDLMMMARPFLEDIYQFLEGAYCGIIVTDGAGCILDVEGDIARLLVSPDPTTTRGQWSRTHPLVIEKLAARLKPGTIWSEGHMGTNAIGLAMLTAMPIQIVGAEHYHETYHPLASSAAPIHDANGRIIGIISIIEPVLAVTRHSLSLVMAAARAITNQMQAEMYLHEASHHLSEMRTILEVIHEGIITWDTNGNISHINSLAEEILQLKPASILGKPYQEVLQFSPELQQAIDENDELLDVETSLISLGKEVTCLASLRPVTYGNGQRASYVAMLRPIEQVRKLVHQQVGTQALLTLDDMLNQSARMRTVMRQARTAARGTAPVLLRGEGGVGKNHLARAIHNDSKRRDKPFLALNCRAIPHELMITEFLGLGQDAHSKGRPSKFELADGGTLMFDQIEGLSLEMQSALLHIIETGHVMRLGSVRPIPVNVRVIAATAVDLEQYVADGQFSSHLYYRFGVFNIAIPPLRDRPEDIPLLAERFLARISERDGQAAWIDDDATTILCRYPWPGNVRELESTLERAHHHSNDNSIHLADLPEVIRQGRVMISSIPQAQPVLTAVEAEREAIIRAGQAYHGQLSAMAKSLGIGRTTLWRKMKRYNLTPEKFK